MHNILIFAAALLALPISALPARQVAETVKNSPSDLFRKDIIDDIIVGIPVDVNDIPVNVNAPIAVTGNNVLGIGNPLGGDATV